jgi:hypothetical protein
MKPYFLLVVAAGLLAACGGGNYSAPRNLDNACLLAGASGVLQRDGAGGATAGACRSTCRWPPSTRKAGSSAMRGPPHVYRLGIIPMGRMSSAYGYSQALDGTWAEYQRETGTPLRPAHRYRRRLGFHGLVHDPHGERNGIPLTRRAQPVSRLSRGACGLSPGQLQRQAVAPARGRQRGRPRRDLRDAADHLRADLTRVIRRYGG